MATFVVKKGIARAVRDMNVRIGAPSLTAKAKSVAKGATFAILGYVSDGPSVSGISRWYKTDNDTYIWSGNVEFVADTSPRVLHAPLAYLACTQRFGERPELYKKFGSPKGHNGLDFRTWVDGKPSKWKQPVFAVLGGTVHEAAFDAKFKGNYIRIRHENGYESAYLHLSKLGVVAGQKVKAGEEIGISGNTGGASEAPHLHFGYRPIKHKDNGYMGYEDPATLFIDDISYV